MQALTRDMLADDPIEQFGRWFEEAQNHPEVRRATPVCVSTIDENGFPDSRMVLLKHYDAEGFVFYTNMHSPKARELQALPRAAMCFYWEAPQRQVRIQGTVQPTGEADADAYWATRPRESQVAAWVSEQSAVLESRELLDRRVAEMAEAFEGRDVPRPPFWSGFRVVPLRMEFWQERPNRLHDRFGYRRDEAGRWIIERLYP